jgi:histidine ammonia-lyase
MLISTSKFRVWGTSEEAKGEVIIAENESKGSVLLGGKKITLDDVFKVGAQNFNINLDVQGLNEVSQNASKIGDSANSSFQGQISLQEKYFPKQLCRAAVFYRVASIMQGHLGIRSSVVSFLADIINNGIVPCFSSVENANLELVAIFYGLGYCHTQKGILPTIEAFNRSNISGISLNKHEYDTLLSSEFVHIGMITFLAASAHNLFKTLDVVASYSFEVCGASLASFDTSHFEVCRQQRGLMASATNLRLLLEDTKASQNFDFSKCTVPNSFVDIPQFHGPANDSFLQLIRYLY